MKTVGKQQKRNYNNNFVNPVLSVSNIILPSLVILVSLIILVNLIIL
jgi:hypothetical protein